MRRILLAALLSAAAATPAAGQALPSFLGRWVIAKAEPAPWYDPADPGTAPFPAEIVGQTIVLAPARITGPRHFACRRPRYRLFDALPEGLFQGGLTRPAAQAAALGFRGTAIRSLDTGCEHDIDWHFVDADTALLALDNRIYRLVRTSRR